MRRIAIYDIRTTKCNYEKYIILTNNVRCVYYTSTHCYNKGPFKIVYLCRTVADPTVNTSTPFELIVLNATRVRFHCFDIFYFRCSIRKFKISVFC